MSWNDDKTERLKKLWADGFSASQIANRLGEVTRNAVIGKVHRLGLADRATTTRSAMNRQSSTKARKKTKSTRLGAAGLPSITFGKPTTPLAKVFEAMPLPPTPADEVYIPLAERKGILDLEPGDCRWPIGDPRSEEFHFCGKRKVDWLPYCELHARRAYQPPAVRGIRPAGGFSAPAATKPTQDTQIPASGQISQDLEDA